MLTYILRSISAEALKLKRSLVLIVTLVIPLFPAVANVGDGIRNGFSPNVLEESAGLAPWSILLRFAFKLWTIFALPMIVAIISALLANTDHQPKTWKLLFALPFPRQAVFIGKWVALAGLLLLSNLAFALANLAGGLFIHFLHPEAGLGLSIPIGELVFGVLVSWLLSLFMVSIHLWISLRWSSFLASITVGFAATVSNLFLIASYMFGRSALSPWAMPAQVYTDWSGSLPAALAGAVLVGFLAMRGFVRRDVT
jgi:ABC-2 type transport system permease protein